MQLLPTTNKKLTILPSLLNNFTINGKIKDNAATINMPATARKYLIIDSPVNLFKTIVLITNINKEINNDT